MTSNTTAISNDRSAPFRIGILGAARIARKNVAAILHPSSCCTVTAVASRTPSKGTHFVENYVEKELQEDVVVFGGENAYNDLVSSEGIVDAVYIPLPTSLHEEWVSKALNANKHVLVEKPVALTVNAYHSILKTARFHNKYLQDGTMFVHHPRTIKFLQAIGDKETFGKVLRINSNFTFLGDEEFFDTNIRTKKDGDSMGCIGDLGWYCVRVALLVFDKVGGKELVGKSAQVVHMKKNEEGVPIDASCIVTFGCCNGDDDTARNDDFLLSFHCSFCVPSQTRVEVCGTKSSAIMNDFVIPALGFNSFCLTRQDMSDKDEFSIDLTNTVVVPTDPAQEVLMWKNFARVSRGLDATAKLNDDNKPGNNGNNKWSGDRKLVQEANDASQLSLKTQIVIIALMESVRNNGEKIVFQFSA